MTSATSATSEGAQGIFSKITFLKSVRSNKKDEVCQSFLVVIFTKSLHRGGVPWLSKLRLWILATGQGLFPIVCHSVLTAYPQATLLPGVTSELPVLYCGALSKVLAQTVKFMFLNAAYRPTVYKTGYVAE